MEVNTYSAFADLVARMQLSKAQDNYNFDNALKTLQGIVYEDDIKYFYAKNIFNKEHETELILFLDTSVLLVKADNEKTKVTSLNRNDILSLEFEFVETGIRTAYLNVKFKNGVNIEFQSLKDGNENWNWKYIEQIKEIFKFLK